MPEFDETQANLTALPEENETPAASQPKKPKKQTRKTRKGTPDDPFLMEQTVRNYVDQVFKGMGVEVEDKMRSVLWYDTAVRSLQSYVDRFLVDFVKTMRVEVEKENTDYDEGRGSYILRVRPDAVRDLLKRCEENPRTIRGREGALELAKERNKLRVERDQKRKEARKQKSQ